jgi:hypothetical protein
MHRTKSILAALAAVALSATAVFAAAGTAPADAAKDGLARAATASTLLVPVRADSPDTATTHERNKPPEAGESPDLGKSPDLARTKAADTAHPDNHGALVSAAAKAVTPAAFANHGAYVRSIAMQNHGHGAASAKTHGTSGETHPAN